MSAFVVPEQLAANADFMLLYRIALLGTTNKQREDVDRLIVLAFSAGKVAGADILINAIKVPTP